VLKLANILFASPSPPIATGLAFGDTSNTVISSLVSTHPGSSGLNSSSSSSPSYDDENGASIAIKRESSPANSSLN